MKIEVIREHPEFLKDFLWGADAVQILKKPDGPLSQSATRIQTVIQNHRNQLQKNVKSKKEGADGGKSDADLPKKMEMDPESLSKQRKALPVYRIRDEFLKAIQGNQVVVVTDYAGSGTTTQIPQYIMESGFQGKICCIQPRRIAAKSPAMRVALEMGVTLGKEVGYAIRFDDWTSADTRVNYLTNGLVIRNCMSDPLFSQYSCLIMDEAQESLMNNDVLLPLIKDALKQRKDLKLILLSAGSDKNGDDKLLSYFPDATQLSVPYEASHIDIVYSSKPVYDYLQATVDKVMDLHEEEGKGDILVFLTGKEDIDLVAEMLRSRMKSTDLVVLPLYSTVPLEKQEVIFKPMKEGLKRVILCSNIVETSMSIPGVKYVVDPGIERLLLFNHTTRMDDVVPVPISKASAKLRADRAGKSGSDGKCFRLYTERSYDEEMHPDRVPEIQRMNLSNVVLTLKAIGIDDLKSFDFLNAPPKQYLMSALHQLYILGALDPQGNLTDVGRKMASFPLDISISKMLITSTALSCSEEVLTIASMLSVPNPIASNPSLDQDLVAEKKARFQQKEGDLLTLLAIYKEWERNEYSTAWCDENFINIVAMKQAQNVRINLKKIMEKEDLEVTSCGNDLVQCQKAILSGCIQNVARRNPDGESYQSLVTNQTVQMPASSSMFQSESEWFVFQEPIHVPGMLQEMNQVTAIEPQWLVEFVPRLFRF